jgi:hypothetical protein
MSIFKGFLAVEELRHPATVKTIAKANAMAAARRRKDVIDAIIPPRLRRDTDVQRMINFIAVQPIVG